MIAVPNLKRIGEYEELVSLLTVEKEEEYQSQRDKNTTSSSIKDFIKSKRSYQLKHRSNAEKQPTTEALYMGTLTHVTILEGPRKVMADYEIGGPLNKDGNEYGFISGKFKTAEEEVRLAKGKKLARLEDYTAALEMRRAVLNHANASDLLSMGEAERVVRRPWMGMPCQIRMDMITPYGIIDLKTVADIERFYNGSDFCDVHKYGYLYSAAFYRLILHRFYPKIPRQPFYFIVVEKKAPHIVGVWRVSKDVLDDYEGHLLQAMTSLKSSEALDDWECPYEDLRIIEI